MAPRKLIFVIAIALLSCVRKPEQFWTRAGHDRSIIFPVSVGSGLVEVEAQNATYDLDGEVLRALMIAGNDYIPPGIPNPPCWARLESLEYRFTRRDDIIFVYISEDFERCGRKLRPMHYGAKYAISKDGRILRRVIDGVDDDDHVWSLETPDGGRVTVVTESRDSPTLEDLDRPDSGVLRVTTEPVTMPGVIVIEPVPGFVPVPESPDFPLGNTMSPLDDAGTCDLDGGTPDAGVDGGSPDGGAPGDAGPLSAPPAPPDAGAAAP
ncbi:hypothetical protein ATI61_107545 [Archangium gephyra]|uniref:Lipoprotein n=1 Tax=Archangium gephyra TaxID=48 RepID=A0ABX9JZN1_9BACT|nr:hypothetical protein [Archangium gephyra]REG29848.1 hypothetical protein ATI61_107545 [Archangium gephyra]